MKASSICGSDLRAIDREHLGEGDGAYGGVVAGHEPSGELVAVGPGWRRLSPGDRVVVDHIAGCGQCDECLTGHETGCTHPARAAYGWQRDGGHADFLLAEERSCLELPEPLTYVDGALVSCGFGTAWEALLRTGVSGRDWLLVTGPGMSATVDCSGAASVRSLAVSSTARWGRCTFVGEGARSPHRQVSVHGSWVTSLPHMRELLDRLVAWGLHPERVVTHRFPVSEAAQAYREADPGTMGKICIVWN